jgi:hypothetical protein
MCYWKWRITLLNDGTAIVFLTLMLSYRRQGDD